MLQMPPAHRYPMAVEGPPVTQPSSISVTSQSQAGQEKNNGTRNAIAAMIGVFIGATVLGGALWWNHRQSTLGAGDEAAGGGPTGSASSQPAPSFTVASEQSAHPAPTNSSPVINLGTVDIGEETRDAGAPSKPTPVKPSGGTKNGGVKPFTPPSPAPAPAPSPKGADAECATPYWYDAAGVKHYKPQCLGKQ
jgi:hypothetical protein